jgi:hypothetical protein
MVPDFHGKWMVGPRQGDQEWDGWTLKIRSGKPKTRRIMTGRPGLGGIGQEDHDQEE